MKQRRNLIEKSLLSFRALYEKLRNAVGSSDNKTMSKIYLRIRNVERNIMNKKYDFVTVDELLRWTTAWIKSFSTSYDVIVGIPRSGLLVANLIALKLGKPLTTPELFRYSHYWKNDVVDKKRKHKNILLVDDSIASGNTMQQSEQLLHSYSRSLDVTRAALIASEDTKDMVDLYHKIIPPPRIFEWNLLNSRKGKLATNLEGVICENCPPGVDLDEKAYTGWIRNAKPYLIPPFYIDTIMSKRLYKYRSDTEEWLARHDVRYGKLMLCDFQFEEQRERKRVVQRKIEFLLKIKPLWFWGSSFSEAKQIWEATKIPTLCIDEMVLFR